MAGRHRSPHAGQALEFVGHRAYTPSDEYRRIDWKVFAKTDRWVVREQQEDTHLRATLLIDTSRSMDYAGAGRLSKTRYAGILAAALSYLLTHNQEAVGLGLFNDKLEEFFPPRGGAAHLARLLEVLEEAPTGGGTNAPAVLEAAGQRLPRRGLVMLVSDFWAPLDSLLAGLRTLLARRHEVAALQVLDPDERDFSLSGDFRWEDLETGAVLRADAEEIRETYRRLMRERQEKLRRGLASLGVDFYEFDTALPLEKSLSLFLERRMNRG